MAVTANPAIYMITLVFVGRRPCRSSQEGVIPATKVGGKKPRMGRHIYSRGWSMRSMRNPRYRCNIQSNPEGVTQWVTTGVSISSGQLCHPFGVRSSFVPTPGVARALRAHPRLFMCRPIRGFALHPIRRCATPSGFGRSSNEIRGLRALCALTPGYICVGPSGLCGWVGGRGFRRAAEGVKNAFSRPIAFHAALC